jgi:DNA polymerase elongation subunit (family B)
MKLEDRPIYTLDAETDPFQHGRKPEPFSWDFYDGEKHHTTWGDNCTEEMIIHIRTRKAGIIYMHNGGRFDIYFLIHEILNRPMKIINGRIAKAQIECDRGRHEIRDSYSIIPVPLKLTVKEDGKLDIEYSKLERDVRDEHRIEIILYLHRDTELLWKLCVEFVDMFGVQLTIGGTAMKELRKVHEFTRLTLEEDKEIRGKYFYGGRVECFESGIIEGQFKVYDVNSMYPYAMKTALHPAGRCYHTGSRITKDTCFITAKGYSRGAFPVRPLKGNLNFDHQEGWFHVTRHEWDMAEELGLFDCEQVIDCQEFDAKLCFDEFVDKFYDLRMEAQAGGDEIRKLFYKLVMNSAYGKFAQSSENYCEFRLTDSKTTLWDKGWELHTIHGSLERMGEAWMIWSKPSLDETMYNVATGCSITGAARAILMHAIHGSKRPIYCDTDSLICESLPGVEKSKELGAWKLEAECTRVAMAGKKLYALFDADGGVVKQANKGVKISAEDIVRVCEGAEIECLRDAPSFKLDGSHRFIDRIVRMTV